MAYIGKIPAAAALTSSDLADDIITEAKMANDAISLAELKSGTDGELISWDASGNPVAIGAGTSGHFLKSQGAGSQPVFAAASGGKVLQVVEAATTTAATTTSTSFVTTGLQVAITPAATSSKILVFATWVTGFIQSDKDCRFQLFRDSTTIGGGADNDRYVSTGGGAMNADTWFTYGFQQFNIQKLDSPNSTSELTYKVMFNVNSGSGATGRFGEQRNGDNAGNNVICAMEIGA